MSGKFVDFSAGKLDKSTLPAFQTHKPTFVFKKKESTNQLNLLWRFILQSRMLKEKDTQQHFRFYLFHIVFVKQRKPIRDD